jgi:hypothetical protein
MWGEFITNSGGSIISDNLQILAHPNSDRYSIVHPSELEFHLEIRDIRLSDGGTYVCQDTLATPPNHKGEADLIVLGSNPNCTNTAPSDGNVLEGQSYTIECTVNYQGGYAPTMTWTGPAPFSTGGSTTPTSVWAGVAYVVNRTMDTRSFECLTNFTSLPALPPNVASNVPSYSNLYRAPQIFVFWGPKNLYAEPIKPYYVVGENITCTADAFPPATYSWQNMRTLQIYAGRVFTITPDMVGFNQTLRCEAKNTIQGFVYSDNLFVVAFVPTPTTATTPPSTQPTTTYPLVSNCNDLSGHWRSDNPYAEMILDLVDGGQIGEIIGIVKNETSTTWVEVVGTTRKNDFAYLGLSAIWPLDQGVTGWSGECHRCSGEEVILLDGMWRSIADSTSCGEGSRPVPRQAYELRRVGSTATALGKESLKVYKPTNVSKRLGVNLK